jgi:hypothetical protein
VGPVGSMSLSAVKRVSPTDIASKGMPSASVAVPIVVTEASVQGPPFIGGSRARPVSSVAGPGRFHRWQGPAGFIGEV